MMLLNFERLRTGYPATDIIRLALIILKHQEREGEDEKFFLAMDDAAGKTRQRE